jgi:hypothetical protein
MKGMMAVCALFVLASPVLHAQHNSSGEQPNRQSNQQFLENRSRASQEASMELYRANDRKSVESVAAQARIRVKLAQAWQALGMSPEGAKLVADAFHTEHSGRFVPASLEGKSEDEVAAMLRDALSRKNYLLADQLLIQYEQARLSFPASTAPSGIR